MTEGYSNTPLFKKLGIKSGMKVYVINAPENYLSLLEGLPEDVSILHKAPKQPEIIHWFITTQKELLLGIQKNKSLIPRNGSIWVSWPKKSSKKPSDLDDNVIRTIILEAGLVDVKVCAVDETWSAMKSVYRLKDR